jgi:syntaxin 18
VHSLYAEQLTLHRSAITQYLSKRLASANSKLGDMQEARLRAQQKRRLNLGGSAAAAASRSAGGGSSEKQAVVAGSVRVSGKAGTPGAKMLPPEDGVLQTDFTASDLTPQQVQQFEEESSALIKSLSEDLNAIEQTNRKLGEISDMQTQLIQHLGSQAEVADHLLSEAVGHTLEVGKGNEQLQKAKDNHRQASKYLCLFLIGSGCGLLFLHCNELRSVSLQYRLLIHSSILLTGMD